MSELLDYGIKDPTIENSFIASLINRPELMGRVANKIPPEALVEHNTQAVFIALLGLYANGLPFDQITLCNQLVQINMYKEAGERDGVEAYYQNELNSNPLVLGNMILDFHCRRLEIQMADLIKARASNRAGGDDNDMDGRFSHIQTQLQDLQRLQYDDDRNLHSSDVLEYYEAVLNNREAHINDPKMVFKWSDLNRLGPSQTGGNMIVLVADSSAGKTTLFENQGEFLWENGFHGAIYHLELATDEMIDRRIVRWTGISFDLLQDGRKEGDIYKYLTLAERKQIREIIEFQANWPGSLSLKHCPGATMAEICADMRQRIDAGALDFAMVDYFNKVRAVQNSQSPIIDMGADIELFKSTLEDLSIVGYLAAQIDKASKKSKSGVLRVSDGRDVGAILDDKGNIGLSIQRPFDEETGERSNIAEIQVSKWTKGRQGVVSLYFNGPRFKMENLKTRTVDLDLSPQKESKLAGFESF